MEKIAYKIAVMSSVALLSSCASMQSEEMLGYRIATPVSLSSVEAPSGVTSIKANSRVASITYTPRYGAVFSEASTQVVKKMEFAIGFDPTFYFNITPGDTLYKIEIPTQTGAHYCSVKSPGVYAKQDWKACFFDRDSDGRFDGFGLPVFSPSSKNDMFFGGRLGVRKELTEPIAYKTTVAPQGVSASLSLEFDGKILEFDGEYSSEMVADKYYLSRMKMESDMIGQTIDIGGFTLEIIEFEKKKSLTYKVLGRPKSGRSELLSLDLITATAY